MRRRDFGDHLVWFRKYILDALECLRKWLYSCQSLIGGILKERQVLPRVVANFYCSITHRLGTASLDMPRVMHCVLPSG
jgi:hypothetical protein